MKKNIFARLRDIFTTDNGQNNGQNNNGTTANVNNNANGTTTDGQSTTTTDETSASQDGQTGRYVVALCLPVRQTVTGRYFVSCARLRVCQLCRIYRYIIIYLI